MKSHLSINVYILFFFFFLMKYDLDKSFIRKYLYHLLHFSVPRTTSSYVSMVNDLFFSHMYPSDPTLD